MQWPCQRVLESRPARGERRTIPYESREKRAKKISGTKSASAVRRVALDQMIEIAPLRA